MPQASVTHATLLGRLADGGDAGAWNEFVIRYGALIRAFCARRGLQGADIDDVLQDVLLSLSKAMPGFRYDPAKGKFRSYLKTTVSHAISRKLGGTGPHISGGVSRIGDTPSSENDESTWEHEWRQYHVRRAMLLIDTEFNERDRAAFELCAIGGRQPNSVAAELGMSIDAVYQAKSRILKRLTTIIESQVTEEG